MTAHGLVLVWNTTRERAEMPHTARRGHGLST